VRELAPAFSTADSSAVGDRPRRVATSQSGDESPHSPKASLVPTDYVGQGIRYSSETPASSEPEEVLEAIQTAPRWSAENRNVAVP